MHDPIAHPGPEWTWEEFSADALIPPTALQRREFVRLMAASLALTAAAGAGCAGTPPEDVVPHTHNQTRFIPGVPQWYATSLVRNGLGIGVLVRSDDGRPTKIDGNPDHPASLGATDAITQAELLTLYDPERSRSVRFRGRLSTWDALQSTLTTMLVDHTVAHGRGLHIVLPPTTSPTALGLIERVRAKLPEAAWYRHDPLRIDAGAAGATLESGAHADLVLNLRESSAVVACDLNIFGPHAAGVRFARDFSTRRRESMNSGTVGDRRPRPALFVAEPVPTITGFRADDRLPIRRSEVRLLVQAIAAAFGIGTSPSGMPEHARAWAARAVAALRDAGDRGVLLAGEAQEAAVRSLALTVNQRLGAFGRTVLAIEPVESFRGMARPFEDCLAALDRGEVGTLLLVGVNPIYDLAGQPEASAALRRAGTSIHLGLYLDETAVACDWHAPLAHDLESWSDARAYDGTAGIIQPLTSPLYGGRTLLWLLSQLAGESRSSDLECVNRYWRERIDRQDWDSWWRSVLMAGAIEGTQSQQVRLPPASPAPIKTPPSSESFELAINPHSALLDGRNATNAWLQELPDTITQLCWENAALIGPSLADTLHLKTGDFLRITVGDRSCELPALVLPGVAPDSIGLTLGYGRTAGNTVAVRSGTNVRALQTSLDAVSIPQASVKRIGRWRALTIAQLHDSMAGREIVRTVHPDAPAVTAREPVHLPLYEPAPMTSPQQWGMTIDLAACTGCGACVVACQAENNGSVVGPGEVRRGRRMHWIRVDRYFLGDRDNPEIRAIPLACVHCEAAPCELVCPTGATQHSNDGLNEMNYARCIGTRYCSNNCPYKVRRFNFFRFADDRPPIQRMHNPRVTTRGRGVMEKCTYCVQRIRSAEFNARAEDRPIRDGEVVPACQQVCPTQAIVFGDVADKTTRVSGLRSDPRAYSLLGELNTRPRTRHLADVRPTPPRPDAEGVA